MADKKPEHSPIGASGMSRWKNCPGSVALSKTVKNYSSEYADEGTEAHTLGERMLVALRDGTEKPDLSEYDDEMVDAVKVYVDHVRALRRPGCTQLYEHRFHLKEIHEELYGTADCVTYYPDEKLIIITDYKHGAGVFVDAEKNDQLMYYATGAVLSLGVVVHKIRIEIVQPRIMTAQAIRPWECDIFDIMEFADQLKQYALETEKPDAPLKAGDWCRWCAARPKCPLLKSKARELTKQVFAPSEDVDMEELEETLEWLPVLEHWITGTREYAYNRAMAGHEFKRHKLVRKRATRKYKNETKAIKAISKATGVRFSDLFVIDRKAMSPAQVEAIPAKDMKMKKSELSKFLGNLTEKVSSGFNLVPASDDRPTAERVSAKSVFTAHRSKAADNHK